MELNLEDIKQRLDSDGKIKKSDFIEHSMEAKLLDLTDGGKGRKTVGGGGKGKEEGGARNTNVKQVPWPTD